MLAQKEGEMYKAFFKKNTENISIIFYWNKVEYPYV